MCNGWMPRLRALAARLLGPFASRKRDSKFDQEVQSHLQMLADRFVAQGMPPEDAAAAARRQFGNTTLLEEERRELRTLASVEDLGRDLRYALRQLRRNPGFTAVAVITLALGIGANTAIFTLINDVMLKMLPVENPQQLVLLNWAARTDPLQVYHWFDGEKWDDAGLVVSRNFSYRTFDQIRSRNDVFSSVFAFKRLGRVNIVIKGEAGLASGQLVSGDYFAGLGVPAIIGRTIAVSDDRQGAPPVAVISYGFWKRRFGGDPGVLGRSISVNGVPCTIIGVTPPEFYGLTPGTSIEISVPLMMEPRVEPHWVQPGVSLFTASDHWWLDIMGRLKPEVTEQQARVGLAVIFNQSVTEGLSFTPAQKQTIPWVVLAPGGKGISSLRRQFSGPLLILMRIVVLVLLIACANLANFSIVRAIARQTEIAVRLALGAGRRRLGRQLLTESVLVAISGGLLGLILAYFGSSLLVAFISGDTQRIALDAHPDLQVLAFTAVVCLFTGVLFGLAPAVQGTKVDLTPALKPSTSGWGPRRLHIGFAKPLVVSQVALSLVLLFAAGLFVRTLANLDYVKVGFNTQDLLLFGIDPTQDGYEGTRLANLYDQLQERLASLPGVSSATTSLHLLLSGHERSDDSIWVRGYTPKPGGTINVYILPVGINFFKTMQIRRLLGRGFRRQDNENAPKVAIVNETFSRRFFGGQNPIGKEFNWSGPDSRERIQIVGMVQDALYSSLRGTTPPTVYQPFRQTLDSIGPMHFEVRTAADPKVIIPAVRRVVRGLDPDLPLYDVKTQNEQINELLLQQRLFAELSSFFGLLALLLACVGLYGTLSYSVARRTNEIGVRMALGAGRASILGMVLRETFILLLAGIAIGVPAALAAGRLLSSQVSELLYGLKATDHLTVATSALLLIAVGAFAGFVPARRASRVDPNVALRYE
jgi:predicted permease